MKFEFSLIKTHLSKVLAIFLVVISHYYRYANISSPLHFLYHFGFFGAALFAFLSGYGISYSYNKKGFYKHWFLKKIINIYVPFIIIQFLADFFIYRVNFDVTEIIGIFWGKNDGAMWYVIYIMVFYLFFYFVFHLKLKDEIKYIILILFLLVQMILGLICNIPSNLYTSTGALLLGVLVSLRPRKQVDLKAMFLESLFFLLVSLLEIKIKNVVLVSNILTIISGVVFCSIVYDSLGRLFNNYKINKFKHVIVSLSNVSFWVYIIHNKILYYFFLSGKHSLLTFIITSFIVSYILKTLYEKSKKLFIKIY